MSQGNVIIRFEEVSFGYNSENLILDEASFSVREDSKLTLMGQNGAGKSSMFKLIVRFLSQLVSWKVSGKGKPNPLFGLHKTHL